MIPHARCGFPVNRRVAGAPHRARSLRAKCTARSVQVHRRDDATARPAPEPRPSHAIAKPFALRPSARDAPCNCTATSPSCSSVEVHARVASKCTARRVQVHGASRASAPTPRRHRTAGPGAPPVAPPPSPRPSLFRPSARNAPCNCTAHHRYTRGHERQRPPSRPPATCCSHAAATMTGRSASSRGPRWRSSTGRSTGSTWSPRHADALALQDRDAGRRRGRGSRSASCRRASDRLANWLRDLGVARGDRLLLMLGNVPELWEVMLAAMKLGAVLIPASTLLSRDDLADRIDPRRASAVIVCDAEPRATASRGLPCAGVRGRASATRAGRLARLRDVAAGAATLRAGRPDRGPTDPLLLYFTSRHHRAAEAGRAHPRQLPGRAPVDDVLDRPAARRRAPEHLVARAGPSTRGSACSRRGTPGRRSSVQLAALRRAVAARRARAHRVTTLCAPPTVWRMLDPAGPRVLPVVAARAGRRRRAAQPRGDRAGRSGPGGSPSATGTARPRRRCRSATRRASP